MHDGCDYCDDCGIDLAECECPFLINRNTRMGDFYEQAQIEEYNSRSIKNFRGTHSIEWYRIDREKQ